MGLNRVAVGGFALILGLSCLSTSSLYGEDRLELKKSWQQDGAPMESQGGIPQAQHGNIQLKQEWRAPGNTLKPSSGKLELKDEWKQSTDKRLRTPSTGASEIQLKENWHGHTYAPDSSTGRLELKDEWKKPSGNRYQAPSTGSGELQLKDNWKQTGSGTTGQRETIDSKPNGLQLNKDWKYLK